MNTRLLILLFLSFAFLNYAKAQAASKPNVIFIIVDDLNDYIEGFNGHPQIMTPNIKSLAERGYLFYNGFCNAPVCGPSRTSFLSGKDLSYTQVFNNDDYNEEFRDNFLDSLGNEEVITIPEHLKNAGGYYTIGVNKIFHKPSNKDYDNTIADPCLKELSWSKVVSFNDFEYIQDLVETYNIGIPECNWGILPDSLEPQLKDYRTVDTAINYLSKIISGETLLCDSAFFLAVGFDAPHLDLYFPEKYFPDDFLSDFYAEPFNYPYNNPADTFPANGIIMPPQPEIRWDDYYHLGPLGQEITASQGDIEDSFIDYTDTIMSFPEINPDYTDEQRKEIYLESMRANAMMAYMAGIQYMDAQVGRLMDFVATQPDIYNNTIIIFVGDNGFSFGEKHHWMKRTLWEPDVRVPFILVDPRKDSNIICEQTVGLLDIFPTICELTGTPMPLFSDSSNYLDGRSLVPIIENPDLIWEHPILISFEAEDNKECSCSPQMAVRSAKYKYIRYASDGGDPAEECISDLSFTEEELYDIGINREVDPYEWNNLINEPTYKPLIEFLQQWLPDSAMYLKNAFTLKIDDVVEPCLYASTDSIELSFELIDTLGNPSIAPLGYTFRWTNSLTNDTLWGDNVTFKMNTIPAAILDASTSMSVYAQMIDNATGAITAFDFKTYLVNPGSAPNVAFTANQVDYYTFNIDDIIITGDYYTISWDFGDGYISNDANPGSHTYASTGSYTITCYTTYGNDSNCVNQHQQLVYIDITDTLPNNKLNVFPSPTSGNISVFLGDFKGEASITICNSIGQEVFFKKMDKEDYPYYHLSTDLLSAGVYFVTHTMPNNSQSGNFVVTH